MPKQLNSYQTPNILDNVVDIFPSPLFGLLLIYSIGLVNVNRLCAHVTLQDFWAEVAKI